MNRRLILRLLGAIMLIEALAMLPPWPSPFSLATGMPARW